MKDEIKKEVKNEYILRHLKGIPIFDKFCETQELKKELLDVTRKNWFENFEGSR